MSSVTRKTQQRLSNRLRAALQMTSILLPMGIQAAPPSPVISFGPYQSHQVNVNALGQNLTDDRGNEPTIAQNPLDPNNIVIGWRHFDQPASGIRHAGVAYSYDGGNSWNTDKLPAIPGQSRSDPVLETDSQGNFYYQSLALGGDNQVSIFKSVDGGASWGAPVNQFYGDKNWLVIDKTGTASDGHFYSTWRRSVYPNPDPNYRPKYFSRSTDHGLSHQEPSAALPVTNFGFGRLAVGANGEVLLSGIDETVISSNLMGIVRGGFYVLKSVDAMDPAASPTFSAQKVDMGGDSVMMASAQMQLPNPLGGDGDMQIATDLSNGNIYLMAQAMPYNWQVGSDPQNVYFVRSSDGGSSWSAPIRLNDDLQAANAFQWFPMLSVAPNSRIDAVWYDTRNGTAPAPYRHSQLFYSYSWDGGISWSPNRAVTPIFDSHLPVTLINGVERPVTKLGDYTHMISDANGAHIAYAATYNGDQDVYYLNVFPDCNNNAISDVLDIQQRRSGDTNSNHLPDACENITVSGDLDGDRDVDQHDLKLLLAARNQPASGPNDPRDLDRNGIITVLDGRKLSLLCTRLRCV